MVADLARGADVLGHDALGKHSVRSLVILPLDTRVNMSNQAYKLLVSV